MIYSTFKNKMSSIVEENKEFFYKKDDDTPGTPYSTHIFFDNSDEVTLELYLTATGSRLVIKDETVEEGFNSLFDILKSYIRVFNKSKK